MDVEGKLFKIGNLVQLSFKVRLFIFRTLEVNFLFEQNSNFLLFYDYCLYERKTKTAEVHDSPTGIGVGCNFETRAGVFSIFYALGKQFEQRFELKNAKIHFGYAVRF